jgi:putative holliday junction resolvase
MSGAKKLYHLDVGRILAVDVGARRVGLAISDASRTLARPLETIAVSSDADAVRRVARRIAELDAEDDGIAAIVVGLPTSLDGMPTPQTAHVTAFIASLMKQTRLPIATEDERLTSREAESRLAVREKDWRKRKARIDAEAAAIFLQDYLDRTKNEERRT